MFSLPPRSLRHRMRRAEAVVQAEIDKVTHFPRNGPERMNHIHFSTKQMPRWRRRKRKKDGGGVDVGRAPWEKSMQNVHLIQTTRLSLSLSLFPGGQNKTTNYSSFSFRLLPFELFDLAARWSRNLPCVYSYAQRAMKIKIRIPFLSYLLLWEG